MADKPTWSLDQIYWNAFREGAWPGLPNTLTYSFPTQVPASYKFGLIPINEGKSFSSFSLEQKSWAEFAVQQWADVVRARNKITATFMRVGRSSSTRHGIRRGGC